MAKPRTKFENAYQLKQQGVRLLEDNEANWTP